jgi:hypothetical protein
MRTQEKKTRKLDHLRLFALKHESLKISLHLQTVFEVETHRAEGHWLKEQLNMLKLRMYREGTRMTNSSRTEG